MSCRIANEHYNPVKDPVFLLSGLVQCPHTQRRLHQDTAVQQHTMYGDNNSCYNPSSILAKRIDPQNAAWLRCYGGNQYYFSWSLSDGAPWIATSCREGAFPRPHPPQGNTSSPPHPPFQRTAENAEPHRYGEVSKMRRWTQIDETRMRREVRERSLRNNFQST